MPKFLYSIYLLILLLWGLIIYQVLTISPDNYRSIFIFLFTAFICLGVTLSIPLYYNQKRKNPNFTDYRSLYRRGLKWGSFISLGIVSLMFFKALDLINLLNLGLFLLLYVGIYYQIKSNK